MNRAAVVGGLVFTVFGAALLGGAVLVMNEPVERAKQTGKALVADFAVQKKKKKKAQKRRPKKKRKPRRTNRAPAPRPNLATDLGGLGVGLPVFDGGDLSGVGDSLLAADGMTRDLVMTESAVDRAPQPLETAAPEFPARARRHGIEGYVVLKLLIGADGNVRKVGVVSASPEGVFEEAAIAAARRWRFEPAMYQGQAVSLAVTRRLTFKQT